LKFLDKLDKSIIKNNSQLCVGLDPDPNKIELLNHSFGEDFSRILNLKKRKIFSFCKNIIDSTSDLVCAFKPQIAFFAANRAEKDLEMVCEYIRKKYPDILIILDAKRGDIESTAKQYAFEVFDRYGADAVTVNPYLGFDSIEPYLEWRNKGVIVLCKTSNFGGKDIQCLIVKGKPLFFYIANLVNKKWNINGQCGLVVGGNHPKELSDILNVSGNMPILVPGIGFQGGDIKEVFKACNGMKLDRLIFNSSRSIIYPTKKSSKDKFPDSVRKIALETRNIINFYKKNY
tara:strand:+ start:19 stop:882 length:864 start_codon:yes stop_codon:yes gene_type:complete